MLFAGCSQVVVEVIEKFEAVVDLRGRGGTEAVWRKGAMRSLVMSSCLG